MDVQQFDDTRWELRMTHRQLAKRLGVSPETVSRWKAQKRFPLIVALALAGLLCERKHARREDTHAAI